MTHMDNPEDSGPGGGYATGNAPPPTTSAGQSSDEGLTDKAGQAASTAVDEGKHVTGVAGEEAQKVAAEAKQQGKVLLEDAKGQLEEQSRAQRDRLVQTLSSLGDDLTRMSSQADSGLASGLVDQAAQQVRGLTNRLEGREPADLLDDVRDFARRKPGTFLLGALAAGIVAGRLARGAKEASSSSSSPGAATGTTGRSTTSGRDAFPTTPSTPAMATYPPDQRGEIR